MVDTVNEEDDDHEYVKDEEEADEEYTNEICGDEQWDFVCIVQKILCSPKQYESTQCTKIFQAKC